jgi:hypothetical protein
VFSAAIASILVEQKLIGLWDVHAPCQKHGEDVFGNSINFLSCWDTSTITERWSIIEEENEDNGYIERDRKVERC